MAGCQPDFGVRASAVQSLRVLAVSADPPEAAPGAKVSYAALVVDGAGQRDDALVDWAYCKKQKALAQLDDADPLCFVFAADYLVPLGKGTAVAGKLPSDACSLFGPDVPPAQPGMPPGRPVDPDATGGFYQPVRLILPDPSDAQFPNVLGLGESRVGCGLAGATAGTFDADSTSAAQLTDLHVDNAWTAPGATGAVKLWVVLRDDRGGVSWERYAVAVQ